MTLGDRNKVIPGDDDIIFIRGNYERMTTAEFAVHFELKLNTMRTILLGLGLKRMEMEYWTEEQIWFLTEAYHEMGDFEIALILDIVSPKNKPWTKKHTEKKRNYLKLHRTKAELKKINQRNAELGFFCHWKIWATRGVSPVGTIVICLNSQTGKHYKAIKTGSGFVNYAPWLYEQIYGLVPKGYKVRLIDNDPMNVVIENLMLVTTEENARLNSKISSIGLSDNYVAALLSMGDPEIKPLIKLDTDLIELKRNQLLLNRAINGTY